MGAVLEISEARKRFGDTVALDGAALTLSRGEWLALLGPNGAGKTTLVRAVAGRLRLDGGAVTLFDRALDGTAGDAAVRRRIGVVPQDIALYPSLTAEENLRAFADLNSLPGRERRERVSWALAWTGLEPRAGELVRGFSGGMKRRLNLACGVLHRPEVILLDEPTVGVDPQSRERIWEMLTSLQRDGASLLLTTHQLDEAQQVSDRIVIIDHGRAIADGTFTELLNGTIGAHRRVTITLAEAAPAPLLERGFEAGDDERTVRRRIEDIAAGLPGLLAEVDRAGGRVTDLRVDEPSLQAIFLHLTGRELREMIATIVRIGWLNLRRDRVALGLTFILPIIFFTIFALIFGGMGGGGGGGAGSIRVLAVDADGSAVSERFLDALAAQDALDVLRAPSPTDEEPTPPPFTRDAATDLVRSGKAPVAVVIPEGFGTAFGSFDPDAPPVEVIHDPSNPLALYTISGLIQASAMSAAPDVLMQRGLDQLEIHGGGLTDEQQSAIDQIMPSLRGDEGWSAITGEEDEASAEGEGGNGGGPFDGGLVPVEAVVAREVDDDGSASSPSIVSYYAAGIGVMFLLFSMAGASGSLLEEQSSGTLDRLLTAQVGMGRLLVGHWLFFTAIGIAQLAVMFAWGAIVFDVDLFTPNHLAGFGAMTVVTCAAASAFGLILAALCRSRAQLSGISTIVILVMSALGGSMVPRFIMPAFMETTSKLTFNGWALDGYLKVFWYDDPDWSVPRMLAALAPQLAVLAAAAILFLVGARLLARRWEIA